MQSLRQRMLDDMRIRNLSKTTQKRYLDRVAVFANHFNVMLSNKLLIILCDYWKEYQPASWLFYGKTKNNPISTSKLKRRADLPVVKQRGRGYVKNALVVVDELGYQVLDRNEMHL